MSLHVNILLWFFSASYSQEPHFRMSTQTERVYASPNSKVLKGMIASYRSFEITSVVAGTSSCPAGWGKVHDRGYVCLAHTKETNFIPSDKEMLTFIPPDPIDFEYDFEQPPTLSMDIRTEPFVPHIHARIALGARGRLWANVEAYENGDSPNWRLKEEREYRFVDIIETKKGLVLERPNGRVTPVSEWYVYPVSQFVGRDMSVEPLPEGEFAAWTIDKEGAAIYGSLDSSLAPLMVANFQDVLNVYPTEDPKWFGISDLFGSEQDGFIQKEDLRIWVPAPPPSQVKQHSIWIDVHLAEQTLTLYQGDEPLYITLISSARDGFSTPTGIFEVYSKATSWDLGSLEGAEESYFMEHVPWVMHFFPRYAVHSAFWHADFGLPASHGCINMSPRDIAKIFEKTSPILPKGWWVVRNDEQDEGTIIRIRKDSIDVPDKRMRK